MHVGLRVLGPEGRHWSSLRTGRRRYGPPSPRFQRRRRKFLGWRLVGAAAVPRLTLNERVYNAETFSRSARKVPTRTCAPETRKMTAAERALRPAVRRVVLRHSALTRICHWINAVCFFALLMSGLQIFNAHPALNFGQTTDFARPLLSLAPTASHRGRRCLRRRTSPSAGAGISSSPGRWRSTARSISATSLLRGGVRRLWPSASDSGAFRAQSPNTRGCAFPRATRRCSYNVLQKLAYLCGDRRLPAADPRRPDDVAGDGRAFPWLVDAVRRPSVGARRPFPAGEFPRRVRRRPPGDGRDSGLINNVRVDDHRPLPHRGARP